MEYFVRKAVFDDLGRIEEIYRCARQFMAETGNPSQWGNTHPPRQQLLEDIQQGNLYVIADEADVHGVFYFFIGEDPTYIEIFEGSWRSHSPYGTIHRIAGDGSGGILCAAVKFCETQISHLRIDTHEDNKIMQHSVEKAGFQRRGTIFIQDGSPRIAYDRLT